MENNRDLLRPGCRTTVVCGSRVCWVGVLIGLAGCGTIPSGGTTAKPGTATKDTEPNNTFEQALKASYDEAGSVVMEGTVSSEDDLDVYSLGALQAGDRITVNVNALTESLDATVGLFDGSLALIRDNDDENLDAGKYDPFFDEIIRHDSDPYYLVVGASAFAASTARSGEYRVIVAVESGYEVPATRQQVLYLDFDGGEVEPNNLLTKQVQPFDASSISPVYAGQDDVVIDGILDSIEENYEAFDVLIVTDLEAVPPGAEYSTIMFGGYSRQAFGIAQSVDHYNSVLGETAIIFTESFSPRRFSGTPTAEELGVAIGNIAAHEAGHLLGLNHVKDPLAIMDGASPADTFLADQDFKIGVLSSDIMEIGFQNAPLLLSESVGLLPGFDLPGQTKPIVKPGVRMKATSAATWCGTCSRKHLHQAPAD